MTAMGSGGNALTKLAVLVLALTASGVYAMHMIELSPVVGFALVFTLLSLSIPSLGGTARLSSPRANAIAAAVIVTLGLALVWATSGQHDERAARIVRDVGWAQTGLGVWLVYSSALAFAITARKSIDYDDAARARWRSGELRFGAELSGRIIVRAQPSWAALVLETAWPEPRPAMVNELLEVTPTGDVAALRERISDKGGSELAEARWDLARAACDVIVEARGREDVEDVGGLAASRFIVAAARVVRDDEEAARILPAIARRA
jgi:hypothetical protein